VRPAQLLQALTFGAIKMWRMAIWSLLSNLQFSVVLGLAALASLPMLAIVGGLLGRIFKSSNLPFVFVISVYALLVIGGSLYLDRAGTLTSARILDKDEGIRITGSDTAYHRYTINVGFVKAGQDVQLRTVSLRDAYTFKRLASQTTLSLVPWSIIVPALAVCLFLVLLAKLKRARGVILIAGLLAIAAFAFTRLRAAAATTERTTATVRRAERIVPGGRRDYGPIDNVILADGRLVVIGLDPYSFVEFEFTPSGRSAPVVAIDVVKEDTAKLEEGGSVPISYAQNAPRHAQTDFSARRAWLQNSALLALVGAVLLLIEYVFYRLTDGVKAVVTQRSAS
jgi:hypothetical protein